jgi:hypothetical protein
MSDSLYMLRCSSRSYFARYTVISVTSRDCDHITWFCRNSASVSLLATLSSSSKNFPFFEILEQRLSFQLKKFHSLLYIHVTSHFRIKITLFVNWRNCRIEFKNIQNVSRHIVYKILKTRRMKNSKTRRFQSSNVVFIFYFRQKRFLRWSTSSI